MSAPISAPLPTPAPGLFWNPYLQIFLTVLLTAAAQILLKIGADDSAAVHSAWALFGVEELASIWTWLGIAAFVASFGGWLYALRFLPLGLAFALTNGVHVFVPLGSLVFLHEKIGLLRGSGIVVIILGIVLLAQSVAKVEEKSMSLLVWLAILVSQLGLVAGQLLLKRAMSRRELGGERSRGWIAILAQGIAAMTVWFLLWLGAMSQVDLSKLMPFEGISPLLIVLGAALFLGERLNWRGWAGVCLTCVGVALVSAS